VNKLPNSTSTGCAVARPHAKWWHRFCLSALLALLPICAAQPAEAADGFFQWLIPRPPAEKPMPYPPAPPPPANQLVPPPGESFTFPVRPDGQALFLNLENTVNLTDYLNRCYYNPYWEGEVWAPWDAFTIVEKSSRTMGTWPEYDQFSMLRIFNNWNKFIERYSGFGP
jgi:hypothetical protein